MNVTRDVNGEKFKHIKDKDYTLCLTNKLNLNLSVRMQVDYSHNSQKSQHCDAQKKSLEWKPKKPHLDYSTVPYSAERQSPFSDLYVTCQVFAGNLPLTVMLKTSYKPMSTNFAKILTGRQKLTMWPDCEADGSEFSKTPYNIGEQDEMDRFEKAYEAKSSTTNTPSNSIFIVADPEISQENPVEAKHRRLVRSHRNSPLDRELKPNPKIRDELAQILRYPPSHSLTAEEKDLLWKFRFYLTRDKRALTKFLKSVVWSDPAEAKQAVDLLPAWVDVDTDDALELLGSSFENRKVRSYAVAQLRSANDDDLLLFLLQLVQGLKFEHIDDSFEESNLAAFLIERSVKNPILGNYFHWYLMVECEDLTQNRMYGKVVFQYQSAMTASGGQRRESLRCQGELIEALANLAKSIKQMRETKRIEKLREFISDPKNGLVTFNPLQLPLDPRIEVNGIIPELTGIFNSSLLPLHLTFSCTDGSQYQAIFKSGDDLRQDQLVIQIITLMDDLLRKENLDLKLMPYKVLATGADHGMMQFIKSQSLSNVLKEGSLLMYLDKLSVDTFGVRQDVMDAYVKSCAGYCVIMYLLGVGDRHLHNLLISPNGNIFHVDFGFILGRDPKPFPAAMKITKEMVEAMGGIDSVHYQSFLSYSFTAYNILRKSANLILNLFGLMVDANIPDIKTEPDKAVWKVEERFQLNLSDDEAIKFFQNLIKESLGAFFPGIIDAVHEWWWK
ncbi:Phosphatidylinositol (PI) 3-kinase [Podila horticola]|nr:Phosphatidylinositol (PI) 3-kinase [Podila horticola]